MFHTIKKERPIAIILGTHHYVQMSEVNMEDFSDIKKNDLESVLFFAPVGASVPIICMRKLMTMFPNMKVW